MSDEPLQEFGYKESNYQRPTLKWECGRLCEGSPCFIGPNAKGKCQVELECVPTRQGDRYACARAASWGGPCENGPLPDGSCCNQTPPCQPNRTIRSKRQLVTLSTAAFCFGLLLLVVGGSSSSMQETASSGEPSFLQRAVSPGELTFQHKSAAQSCANCHTSAGEDFDKWLVSTQVEGHNGATLESRKCLKCHDLGEDNHALKPHSLPPLKLELSKQRLLATESSKANEPFIFSLTALTPGPPKIEGDLACSTCHREHRGSEHQLTHLSNTQCQSCHSQKFTSFADGHHEFSGYPYERTRIHFDHATHYGRHFDMFERIMPNGERPETCHSCHQPDPSGKTMPVKNFDMACGKCHGPGLKDQDFAGIPLFALPGVNPETLITNEVKIGEWPTPSGSIEKLPAFMQLLLASDQELAEASSALGQLDLQQLDAESRGKKEAVEAYLWSIKSLIYKATEKSMVLKTPAGIFKAGKSFTAILTKARETWFPNLETEIKAHAEGKSVDTVAIPSSDTSAVDKAGGWEFDKSTNSIVYRSTGHADPVLTTWLSASVGLIETNSVDVSPKSTAAANLFATLGEPKSAQRCMDCHTVESSGKSRSINWRGRHREPGDHRFVRFSHAPHVTLMKANPKTNSASDCQHCHVPSSKYSLFGQEFTHTATANLKNHPMTPTGGFNKLEKTTCAACHTQQKVGNSCLKCHNYHIGHFGTSR